MKAINQVFTVLETVTKWLKIADVLRAGFEAMREKAIELKLIDNETDNK